MNATSAIIDWHTMPCVIYVRISHADLREVRKSKRAKTRADRDAELLAKVRDHLKWCEQFAEREGLTVVMRFVEENRSAWRPKPGKALVAREAMMDWLRHRTGPAVVVTTEIERLYRDVGNSGEMVEETKRLNTAAMRGRAPLVIVDIRGEVYDLTTAAGRRNYENAAVAAEAEAAKVSERRRNREADRAADGGWASAAPFGYRREYDDDDMPTGALLPEPDQADAIRWAAGWLIEQAAARPDTSPSVSHVAREWNRRGLATRQGNPWQVTTVRRVLTARRLIGIRIHRPGTLDHQATRAEPANETDGLWPPILDAATFDAVQDILTSPLRRAYDKSHSLKYALSGLVFCGKCGHRLRAGGYSPPDGRRRWSCPATSAGGCGGVQRPMTPVEDYVVGRVLIWLREGGEFDAYLASEAAQGGADAAAARLAEIDAEQDEIRVRLGGLAGRLAAASTEDADAVFDAVTTASKTLKARQGVLAAEQVTAEAQLRQARPQTRPDLPDWDAMTPEARRGWLRTYVAKVIIHPQGQGKRQFDGSKIEIVPAFPVQGS